MSGLDRGSYTLMKLSSCCSSSTGYALRRRDLRGHGFGARLHPRHKSDDGTAENCEGRKLEGERRLDEVFGGLGEALKGMIGM